MNALVAEWAFKAEGDLNTVTRELRVRKAPNYDSVCFHSQQSAEKYLKAFLVLHDDEPPRTHNLVELCRLCLIHNRMFEMIRPDLEILNGYGVVIRYPGISASKEDAAEAVRAALRVQRFARDRLRRT
jgi:HEPN domain-containing protein